MHDAPSKPKTGVVERLSRGFERIASWSYDHRWIVLGFSTLLLATSGYYGNQVRFDNSMEAYFNSSDAVYAAYLDYRDEFGSDEISYIVYEAPDYEHGPWNIDVMRKVQRLTEALEAGIPFVEEVTSLTNVEFMEGVPGGLEIYELLKQFPEDQSALLEIRDKVLAKPMYRYGIVSPDARYAAVMIDMERSSIDPIEFIRVDPNGGDELDNLYPQATYNQLVEILARPEFEGIRFHHTGDVPLNAVYNVTAQSESARLGLLSFGVIGIVLLFFFRRPSGVIGPLAVVFLSIVIVQGAVGLLGWDLDLMFIMLPPLLIAIGVADAVHIISEFRAFHVELGDRREAARRTMYLVGTPCLLTSLTTAAGLLAMSISPIKSISQFAVYSSIGVMAAFVLSITLLMFFLSVGRRSRSKASSDEILKAKGGELLRRAMDAVCHFDIRYRRSILVFFGVVFAISIAGVLRLEVDSNFLDEFSDRLEVKRTTHFVDENMGGTGSVTYIFDSGAADGIKDPAVLREIESLQMAAERDDFLVKKTYSIVDILKDINQSFHNEDPSYYKLPETRDLVAQYLLLYEMSGGEEMGEYVNGNFSRANLEIRTRLVETSYYGEFVEAMDRHLEAEPLKVSELEMTGMGALWLELQKYLTQSQIRGFLLAFAVIAAMMCLVFQSLRVGLLSMIPNLSPVLLTLGAMGWMDLPLDYIRLLIGVIAIGIAVDDTIHLLTRYLHEFRSTGNYQTALFASMRDVGRALFITSVVLMIGFLVFLPSILATLTIFGSLVAATVFVALIADFVLMPALVMTFKPFGPETNPS